MENDSSPFASASNESLGALSDRKPAQASWHGKLVSAASSNPDLTTLVSFEPNCKTAADHLCDLIGMLEPWGPDPETGDVSSDLDYYLREAFYRAFLTDRWRKVEDYVVWNTGLFDVEDNAIYAYWEPSVDDNAVFVHRGWFKENDRVVVFHKVDDLKPPRYSDFPGSLIWDPDKALSVDAGKLVELGVDKLPSRLQESHVVAKLELTSSVAYAARSAAANWRLPLARYYRDVNAPVDDMDCGVVQLLLPLPIESVDPYQFLVLVVEEHDGSYVGKDLLLQQDAFSEARLLSPLRFSWPFPVVEDPSED